MPPSTIGDITFMKDLVSEYFAEAFPLLERSKKEIKELRTISNIRHKTEEKQNVKRSYLQRQQQQQQYDDVHEPRSSFASLWKALHTINVLNRNQQSSKLFFNNITPEFKSFSVNVQPPTVTSAEVDHFLSTLNDGDRAVLLREYEQWAKHNVENVMESAEMQTMCKNIEIQEDNHKSNEIKDEKVLECDESKNSSFNQCMHINNIETEKLNVDVSNIHKENEQCKEFCSNKTDNDSNMSTEAVNHIEQMENEDSMSRYKNAWFTELDDNNKTTVSLDMNKANSTSNNNYEKQNKKSELVQKLPVVDGNVKIEKNEELNEEKKKEYVNNAKEEECDRDKADKEQKDPLHEDNSESSEEEYQQEEVDEENSEESDTVSLEESFDQFSRRLLARDEWTKNLKASEQNTQRNKVISFFDQANITVTPFSSQSQKLLHDKLQQSEEEEEEYEPYEILEEEEFAIPPAQPLSSEQKSNIQEKSKVEDELENRVSGDKSESSKPESVRSQNSAMSLTSHINNINVKVEKNMLQEANNTETNKIAIPKGLKKTTKVIPEHKESKSQGWRSYLSSMVTWKDAAKENDSQIKRDNSVEINTNTSQQPVERSRCTGNDATQLQDMTRAENAYLRKRAYDILLANKVRTHDEYMYTRHLHRTMEEQAQLLVNSMLPLIHQLSVLVRQSCALLDVVAELDRSTFGACVVSPSQYLTTPRFRRRCAEITCQALFSTTVTRITCRRCGEVYCPRCCTERGIGPDVTCARPRLMHHAKNNSINNKNNHISRKNSNMNYEAFLLQASMSDRHDVNDHEHRENNKDAFSDAIDADSSTKAKNRSQSFHFSGYGDSNSYKMEESKCKESQQKQEDHISLGWEPICMRCWRVCAENVKRVAMERRRRSLVHQSYNTTTSNNNNNNNVSNNGNIHGTKSQEIDNDDNDDRKHHNTSTHVLDTSCKAHSYQSSTTSQSTSPVSHHSISLEELSVKEAVLLGAYCDKELRLHDGFAPFYVMTDCNNDTVASWDVIAYKLARVGSAWRTHWQDAGKWATVALHYARLQTQLSITNLRTQVKWRELLQNFKQSALSTKKLLLKENKHLPRITYRINKSAHTTPSSKETCSEKQRTDRKDNGNKKGNVEQDNDDEDFVEDNYDEATLLNYCNRNSEDDTLSDYADSSHIMTS